MTKEAVIKYAWLTTNNQIQSLENKGENIFGSPFPGKKTKKILTNKNFKKIRQENDNCYLKDRNKRRLKLIEKKSAENYEGEKEDKIEKWWTKRYEKQEIQDRQNERKIKNEATKKIDWKEFF